MFLYVSLQKIFLYYKIGFDFVSNVTKLRQLVNLIRM